MIYVFICSFLCLNRIWESVKRTGNKKGVTADGKSWWLFLFAFFSCESPSDKLTMQILS